MTKEGIFPDAKSLSFQGLPPLDPITLLGYWIADRYLQWLEKASPTTPNLKKIAELPGATVPGPHHFAWILDRGLKADKCLQWLDR